MAANHGAGWRWVLVLVGSILGVGLLLPVGSAAASTGSWDVSPADAGASSHVVVQHPCGPDAALGTAPLSGDIVFVTPLGEIGENPVVVSLDVAEAVRLACTDGELAPSCIVPVGDADSGSIDDVVWVPCPGFGLCCEGGDAAFSIGPPLVPPFRFVSVFRECGDLDHEIRRVRDGELLATSADFETRIDLRAEVDGTSTGTTSIVSVCSFDREARSREFAPECAEIQFGPSGITSVAEVPCSSIGAAWAPELGDDGSVRVDSQCGTGQVMLTIVAGDMVGIQPVGEPGDARVDFRARAFSLGCDGGGRQVVGPKCFVVVDGGPSGGAVVEGDCGESSLYQVSTGDARLFVPASGPARELAVSGWCWTDSRPIADIGGSLVDGSGGGVSVEGQLGTSFRTVQLAVRCVADGTTGLPSGPERCYEAVLRPQVDGAHVVVELIEDACGTPASQSERVTLITSGDRYWVDADCADGDPSVARVDALGRVQSPVTVDGEQIATDRVESLVARCGADGPLNCYATAFGATLGNGERVVAHRACGFAELRLPDTGSRSLVAALLAASSIVIGVGLRLAARRRTYFP